MVYSKHVYFKNYRLCQSKAVLIELKKNMYDVDKCSCSYTALSKLLKSFTVPTANITAIAVARVYDHVVPNVTEMTLNVESALIQGTFYIVILAPCLVLCLNMAQRTENSD